MAPPNVQQLLQGVCQQVKDHFSNQGGPFDSHLHISNFLRNFEHRQSPSSEKQQGCILRFPFPFSGLSFIRERLVNIKKTQVLDTENLAHPLVASSKGNLESIGENAGAYRSDNHFSDGLGLPDLSSPPLRVEREDLRSGEDYTGHHDDKHGLEEHFSSSMELQVLQRQLYNMDFASAPPSKEVLGRATWTFLHTLAAQFPEKPTRQQQHDVKELMAILSRLYPCKECADHFKEVLRANPVQAGSGVELAQWMCRVHNIVNRSLGKTSFPCQRVDARWGALHCEEGACDLQGRMR